MGMLNLSLFQNAAIFCRTKWVEIGKKRVRHVVFFAGILSVMATISACCGDCEPPYRGSADPVYLSYEELRQSIKLVPPDLIIKSGKIWIAGKYLLINDLNRGIHVFDNADPKLPKNLGLILIPGNVDLAVKDSVLFADSFIDLVAIDLERFPEIVVSRRIENKFPYNPYQTITDPNIYLTGLDQSKGVVIGYTLQEPVEDADHHTIIGHIFDSNLNVKGQVKEEGNPIAH